MQSLYALTPENLKDALVSMGEKAFRAKQIEGFLYEKWVGSVTEMHNLPQSLLNKLSLSYQVFEQTIVKVQKSKDGQTEKFLISLKDDHQIEAVLMRYAHGNSICISTQVGCRMGCSFCASTLDGLARQLTWAEMVEQVALVQHRIKDRISHIVLMGSGEPLDNYDQVLTFIQTISSQRTFNISQRHITLSTCGLVPEIKALAQEKLQITLAISLHNPFDEERSLTMPINKAHSIDQLMDAVRDYIATTHRRVTFEYALIKGVNDTKDHAKALGGLLKGLLVHVNLIPINPIEERDYLPTTRKEAESFKVLLEKFGLTTTIRRELGDDIDAACGQLRRSENKVSHHVKPLHTE